MKYEQKVTDRQVGRNADLFAMKIGDYKTEEERYPFIRILISIIEQAHPEWSQAPNKDKQIAHLVFHMSHGAVSKEETEKIIHLRDMERGFRPIPEKPKVEEENVEAVEAAETPEEAPAEEEAAEVEAAPKKKKASKDKDSRPKKRSRRKEAPVEIEAATLFDEDGEEIKADEKAKSTDQEEEKED